MRVELKKLHTRLSTTAIYVTHDQVEAMTLGDRVVVMKDGLVQQVGEPLELYHTPANRFVAGFLGSPAMNFAAVRVHEADGALHAGSEGFRIDIPAEIGPRLRSYAGRDVTLGIRPEDLQLANGSHPPGLCFEAVVELVERLGAESLLDLQVGRQTMVASVEPTVRAQRGEKLRFAMRPERYASRPAMTACFIASAMAIGSCAPAIAVFMSTPSTPSSIATVASDAVPTPASTMTGTRENSRMMRMLLAFWIPRPDPIGAPSGITAAAPASSSLRQTIGSSLV